MKNQIFTECHLRGETDSIYSGRLLSIACLLMVGLAAPGCGTVRGGRGWGQDAIYPVSLKRVSTAARNALFDPATWVPAAGAVIFTIDNWDEKTATWAARHNPVFGSQGSAEDVGGTLNTALSIETLTTAIATPSGDDPLDWSLAKARGVALEYGAVHATAFSTSLLKDATGRERPDQHDNKSFPSSHTSQAFAYARLSNRNLDSIEMPSWTRITMKSATTGAAASVAWTRVEAHRHFPSDVLAGACLGNFLTTFIHDAFMNLPDRSGFGFYVEPAPSGVWAAVSWEF